MYLLCSILSIDIFNWLVHTCNIILLTKAAAVKLPILLQKHNPRKCIFQISFVSENVKKHPKICFLYKTFFNKFCPCSVRLPAVEECSIDSSDASTQRLKQMEQPIKISAATSCSLRAPESVTYWSVRTPPLVSHTHTHTHQSHRGVLCHYSDNLASHCMFNQRNQLRILWLAWLQRELKDCWCPAGGSPEEINSKRRLIFLLIVKVKRFRFGCWQP